MSIVQCSFTSWTMEVLEGGTYNAVQYTRCYKDFKVNLFECFICVVIASLCVPMNTFHEARIADSMCQINEITINHKES